MVARAPGIRAREHKGPPQLPGPSLAKDLLVGVCSREWMGLRAKQSKLLATSCDSLCPKCLLVKSGPKNLKEGWVSRAKGIWLFGGWVVLAVAWDPIGISTRWVQGPCGLQGLCHAGDGQGQWEILHYVAFWLKKGSVQGRGIVITEPRKGHWLGSASPELNKEDHVLVLVAEHTCPHCVWPCKGDGAWGCQVPRLQPVSSLLPRVQSSWVWLGCLWSVFISILTGFLLEN